MILIIKIGRLLLNVLYWFIKLIPTQKKVTMISRQSNTPSMEFEAIRSKMHEKYPEVKVVMLCRTLDGGVASTIGNKIKYGFHMLTQMVHIASSAVVLLDSYCIAASILNHKKSLTVIQMWHSMGTMKKFGYTALDTEEGTKRELAVAMRMHHNYDYVFASAEAYKDHLAKGFHCEIEKIHTMPLPRLDFLKDAEYAEKIRRKIYRVYPELQEKPTIVYCPTFRKDEEEFEKALAQLVSAVDQKKYNLVVKIHPLSKAKVDEQVIRATEFSSFEMLFVADYVISDYSCIIYEAAVRNIPLYFYNFDMDLYTGNRGLAIDYENELPGVISGNAAEIVKAIEEGSYDMEELERFTRKYVHPTEHATEDIADFIRKYID